MVRFKKVGLLSTVWLFLVTIYSQFVAAGLLGDIASNIVTFKWLADVGISSGALHPLDGFIRLLLAIVIFALFYKGASQLNLGDNIAMVLAFIISAITTIFVPSAVLVASATAMGTLFSVVIAILPFALLAWLYFMFNDHPWIRVVILAVQAVVLHVSIPHITGKTISGAPVASSVAGSITAGSQIKSILTDSLGQWMEVAFVATIVLMIFEIFKAMPSGSGSGESWIGRNLRKFGEKNAHKVPGSEARENHLEELDTDFGLKTKELNLYIEEKKEKQLLEDVRELAASIVEEISHFQ